MVDLFRQRLWASSTGRFLNDWDYKPSAKLESFFQVFTEFLQENQQLGYI